MTLIPGAHLGPYEILSALGAGGMGEVYRARDTKLGRDVALKVLPDAFTHDAERVARFQREAHTLAALNHPNIAGIYGLEESGGMTALVMELVEGEDLSQRISRGAIPLDDALPIAKQIAEALEAAHEQGIIHRDLKPANVKVRSDGMVKILDFGLAKALDRASESGGAGRPGGPAGLGRPDFPDRPDLSASPTITSPAMLTGAGMILGTAAYMSPEQARGKPVDKRADIWAFGCVLFEMLTGQPAFHGEGVSETLASVLKTDPNWRALPAAAPAGLRRLLHRGLEKDPKRRLQAIGEARVEIEDLLVGAPDPATETVQAWRGADLRRAWPLIAGASLLAVALAVPAALYVRRVVPDFPLTSLDLVTPPTTDPFSFALSPDGRQIVFVAASDTGPKLWLRPMDQTTARPLAGTDRARAPFWAPDGRAIGFFADSSLKRIDLTGGPPQVLADAAIPLGGTWNADGTIVFVGSIGGSLSRVGADGGSSPANVPVGTVHGARWSQFLPDGRRFLFYSTEKQAVYLGSLDGGEPRRVVAAESAAAYAAPGYLILLSQGALLARRFDAARGEVSGDALPIASGVASEGGTFRAAFAVSATGVLAYRGGTATRRQLNWVDRAGKTLSVLLPAEDTGLASLDLAPDGKRVAVSRIVQGNLDVWLIEVARGIASRFTFDRAASPLWSPDASRLVFRAPPKDDLFEKAVNEAADKRPLLVTPEGKAPMAWSPDGQFLLYATQHPKSQSDLWALPMTGPPTPVPVATTSFDEVQGQFSPNGRWVAYASNESSGSYEIYIQPFPGPGGKTQASTAGGIYPRWRHDGQELFYVAPDSRMMAVPVHATADAGTLSVDAPVALFATRISTGNTGNAGYTSRAQYAVAPDGRFLLIVSAEDAAPITIVRPWTALLRK